jgi:hypothetical protein
MWPLAARVNEAHEVDVIYDCCSDPAVSQFGKYFGPATGRKARSQEQDEVSIELAELAEDTLFE